MKGGYYMKVAKLIDTLMSCDHCKYTSEHQNAYKIHINNTVIVLCEECKHELTFELISN